MFACDDEKMKSLLKEMDGLTISINYGDMEFAHNFIGKGCATIKVNDGDISLESEFESEEITQERFVKYGFGDEKDYQELLEWNSDMEK